MNAKDAAYQILKEAGEPLHYKEITKRILDTGLWSTKGKTPEATIISLITVDIKKNGLKSRFVRSGKGIFASNPNILQEYKIPQKPKIEAKTFSFTNAAEIVLDSQKEKKPMHYKDITNRALSWNLIKTSGKTPEATLYAGILNEIRKMKKRGDQPRFTLEKAMVTLTKWSGRDLHYKIAKHNEKVRTKLLKKVKLMDPIAFEELIGRLLTMIGFEDVEVTQKSQDGGIDVRGTLVVGDVIRTKMAVQVKRWSHNVGRRIVQQVRGSLGTHEQGLIITTSDFGKKAVEEAERSNAIPIGLMNGKQLAKLLAEYDIGVKRSDYKLFDIDDSPLALDDDDD